MAWWLNSTVLGCSFTCPLLVEEIFLQNLQSAVFRYPTIRTIFINEFRNISRPHKDLIHTWRRETSKAVDIFSLFSIERFAVSLLIDSHWIYFLPFNDGLLTSLDLLLQKVSFKKVLSVNYYARDLFFNMPAFDIYSI